MRLHLLTAARSIRKAFHLIQPFTLQPNPARTCKAFTAPWAFPAYLSQALRFCAREPVQLLDRNRWQHACEAFRMSSVDTTPSAQTNAGYKFGPYQIGLEEVFLTTKLSFAFVNLRPVVPDLDVTRACFPELYHEEFLTMLICVAQLNPRNCRFVCHVEAYEKGFCRFDFSSERCQVLPLQTFETLDKSEHVLVCPKRVVPRFVDLSAEEVTDLWLTAQRVGEKLEPFFGGSSLTLAIQDGPEAGQTVPHVHVHILPRRPADFKNNDEIYDEIDKKEKDLGETLNLDQERKDRTSEVMQEEATKLRSLF